MAACSKDMKFLKAAGGYIRKKQDRYPVRTIPQFLGRSGLQRSPDRPLREQDICARPALRIRFSVSETWRNLLH